MSANENPDPLEGLWNRHERGEWYTRVLDPAKVRARLAETAGREPDETHGILHGWIVGIGSDEDDGHLDVEFTEREPVSPRLWGKATLILERWLGTPPPEPSEPRVTEKAVYAAQGAMRANRDRHGSVHTLYRDVEAMLTAALPHLTSPSERPVVVCLCGSTRFYREYQVANYDETVAGKIVLSVGFYPHSEKHHEEVGITNAGYPEKLKETLDELHKRKIDLADEILVVCPGGYIGDSTRSEITYAEAQGKTVRYRRDFPSSPSEPEGERPRSQLEDEISRLRREIEILDDLLIARTPTAGEDAPEREETNYDAEEVRAAGITPTSVVDLSSQDKGGDADARNPGTGSASVHVAPGAGSTSDGPVPEGGERPHIIDRLQPVRDYLLREMQLPFYAQAVEDAAAAIEALETDRDWRAAKKSGAVPEEPKIERWWQCSGCGYQTNQDVGRCKGYCQDPTGESCDAVPCPRCGKVHYWSGSAPEPTVEGEDRWKLTDEDFNIVDPGLPEQGREPYPEEAAERARDRLKARIQPEITRLRAEVERLREALSEAHLIGIQNRKPATSRVEDMVRICDRALDPQPQEETDG